MKRRQTGSMKQDVEFQLTRVIYYIKLFKRNWNLSINLQKRIEEWYVELNGHLSLSIKYRGIKRQF